MKLLEGTCERCRVLESLAKELLADHRRIEPHHADMCALCKRAEAALGIQNPIQVDEKVRVWPETDGFN